MGRGWTRWAAPIKPATVANRPRRGDDDDYDNCGRVLEDATCYDGQSTEILQTTIFRRT